MAEAIRKWVINCATCTIKRLARPVKAQGPLQEWHPRRRFELVALDILTISPRSAEGAIKAVVMFDLFTRFVVAAPIIRETGETVAKIFVDRWVSVFGPPEGLLTDQGPNLRSAIMDAVTRTCGVRKLFTSPYRPQTNGAVERMNGRCVETLQLFHRNTPSGTSNLAFFVLGIIPR